jgi:hypothetical protein
LNATGMTCEHCADTIGVYEPLVIVVRGEARETSRAAEPTIGLAPGERYHRECYVERFRARPSE